MPDNHRLFDLPTQGVNGTSWVGWSSGQNDSRVQFISAFLVIFLYTCLFKMDLWVLLASFFFFFLRLHLRHMEVPRWEVEWEPSLQPMP